MSDVRWVMGTGTANGYVRVRSYGSARLMSGASGGRVTMSGNVDDAGYGLCVRVMCV